MSLLARRQAASFGDVDVSPAVPLPRARYADAWLKRRLLDGDESAFTELVMRYHGRLLRLARVFVSERSVAEEVVQDTWVGVMSGLGTFEGRSTLKTWIFRILVNRAKTRGVREKRTTPFSALPDRGDSGEPTVPPASFRADGKWEQAPQRWDDDTPEKLVVQQETMALLKRAIDALPTNQRAVVTLHDVEGLHSKEICDLLEISDGNLRVLLHRGRSEIRRALDEHLDGQGRRGSGASVPRGGLHKTANL